MRMLYDLNLEKMKCFPWPEPQEPEPQEPATRAATQQPASWRRSGVERVQLYPRGDLEET